MVRTVSAQLALAAVAATSVAAQTATVVIEASNGGAGSDLTNTTITVPLNQRYTNSALDTVSYLFLVGAEGVPLDSVTCTPYRTDNLTGSAGLPFNSTNPSFLSTNTVQVGSLYCNSTDTTTTASSSSSMTSTTTSSVSSTHTSSSTSTTSSTTSTTSSTSTSTHSSTATTSISLVTHTSIFVTTVSRPGLTQSQEIITSTKVVTPSSSAGSNTGNQGTSPTSSAPPSLSSGNAATKAKSKDWRLHGIVFAGIGLLATL